MSTTQDNPLLRNFRNFTIIAFLIILFWQFVFILPELWLLFQLTAVGMLLKLILTLQLISSLFIFTKL